MADYSSWSGAKASPYSASMSQWGMPNDYSSLGSSMGNQMLTQNPVVQPWTGVPKIEFPMAGNGPVESTMFGGIQDKLKSSGFLGSKNADGSSVDGWGAPLLGTAQGLMGAFMGMKQYGLAKQSLAQGKEQFNKNYAAQRSTTNASLEDRQRARVASNASGYESVGDYMNKNGIK